MKKNLPLPSEEELTRLTNALANLDQTVAISMSHIRRVQKWSSKEICSRFSGVSSATIEKYMQQSYQGIRPIHFIAAYSWVTMVPMTSFFKGVKVLETDRGMDKSSIEAIIQCGRLSKKRFQITLDYIYDHLDDKGKNAYDQLSDEVSNEYGSLDDYNDKNFLPPEKLDINDFGEDYYYSISLALKDFRRINNLSIDTIASALGLSINRYKLLEDPNKNKIKSPFPLNIGLRIRLAFHSHSHVEFTQYMQKYPQLHNLRKVQHIRDSLIVEGLRHIPENKKESIIQIMNLLAQN